MKNVINAVLFFNTFYLKEHGMVIIFKKIKSWCAFSLFRLRGIFRIKFIGGCVPVYWWEGAPNFGDLFTPKIVEKITGKKAVNVNGIKIDLGEALVGAGSILGGLGYPNSVVWGAGFMDANACPTVAPKKVLAYRGPKSEEIAAKHSWKSAETYGDPGLLASTFWPAKEKKFKYGIVPHYLHKSLFSNTVVDSDTLIIDVQADFEAVLESISSCERIVSTSLHGLIVAHSYSIPWLWVKFPLPLRKGDADFKFNDFMESVGVAQTPITFDDVGALLAELKRRRVPWVFPAPIDAIESALLSQLHLFLKDSGNRHQ